ncbi:hypothetical protein Pcinc_009280 [Petrolisthes cinctipes]|uniref:Uncharacterized protein n=1 Tax=Petrolisthes cinctipes TaxID=88211 RepID=A0AAE1G531_PETCI|nr:hypothetical protein Pcinc_009280 [Petrolisthes cinctipes]
MLFLLVDNSPLFFSRWPTSYYSPCLLPPECSLSQAEELNFIHQVSTTEKWSEVRNTYNFNIRNLCLAQACWSPLHEASVVGNAQIVKILVEAGSNIAATGLGRWQAIHRAALWGHTEVIHALLDGGANIEAQGTDDCRPIHYAAMRGHIKVLEALVERGCDLCARDGNGSTVLHSAAGGGQLQTVQWLVGQNIPHTILDGNKRTAEDIAQIYGYHHVKWWLYKQSPDAPSSQHNQAKISLEEYERIGEIGVRWAVAGDDRLSSQIPNRPWRIHFQDAQGWSHLHHAAANNKV